MNNPADILALSQKIQQDLIALGFSCNKGNEAKCSLDLFDELITNKVLHKKTEKLFKDGHHARAVEEAYKYIDNIVKSKSGMSQSSITGSALMQKSFTSNKPILKLNAGGTPSEIDEQNGYMQIFAGCMTGIRNPRAHESDWEDTEERALQLIVFANHLIERVHLSEVSDVK